MRIEELLEGKRVCICVGAGGVGKTTVAAAIAMGAAANGKKVAVVTIDPAKRLADALGLQELDNQPRLVDRARFADYGIDLGGELWAMMLDSKATFDEVIERLAPDAKTRDEILANRIYQQLSGAVAGSQEYTAIAKLYELNLEHEFDLLVLDTPPSPNALDFLDAPDRLTQFFEGRALQIFLKPGGFAAKIVGRGTGAVFSVLQRVTGVDLLKDLSLFFLSLGGLIDGFKDRAQHAKELLTDPTTTFLIVSSPEREPIDEAIFFWGRLKAAGMPFGAVIVNRVNVAYSPRSSDQSWVDELKSQLGEKLATKVRRSFVEHQIMAKRDQQNINHLRHEMDQPALIEVPALDGDVHDIGGLAEIHHYLSEATSNP